MLAAELALVFLPRYLVLVDGAFHVGVAALLRDIIQGHGALARHFYSWRIAPVPNLLADLILAGLMLVFDPALSEKLLVAGYIIALPAALAYAVRATHRSNTWLAFFAFPLTFTFAFNYGFYDFSYSVVGFLVVAGYTLRHRGQLGPGRAIVLASLLVLTYFTHVVGCLEALLFVGIVLGYEHLRDRGKQARLRLSTIVLVLAPATALSAWFVLATRSGEPAQYALREGRLHELIEFLTLSWGLTSYSTYEEVIAVPLALMLAVLVVAVLRGRQRLRLGADDGTLLFVLAASIAFAVAPSSVENGGSFITQRLALFPAFGLVLWISAHRLPRRLALATCTVACAVAVGLALARLPSYRQLDSIASDFMSVKPCLATGSTMLQANFAPALASTHVRMDPISDQAGLLAADLRGLDLTSPEGTVPYYLLRFRRGLDPVSYLHVHVHMSEALAASVIQTSPPPLDPLAYERQSGATIDYILLFGRNQPEPAELRSPLWHSFARDLHAGYHLVVVSPHGWLQVFARRGSAAERFSLARCP